MKRQDALREQADDEGFIEPLVRELPIDAFSEEKMRATEAELIEERDAIRHLL